MSAHRADGAYRWPHQDHLRLWRRATGPRPWPQQRRRTGACGAVAHGATWRRRPRRRCGAMRRPLWWSQEGMTRWMAVVRALRRRHRRQQWPRRRRRLALVLRRVTWPRPQGRRRCRLQSAHGTKPQARAIARVAMRDSQSFALAPQRRRWCRLPRLARRCSRRCMSQALPRGDASKLVTHQRPRGDAAFARVQGRGHPHTSTSGCTPLPTCTWRGSVTERDMYIVAVSTYPHIR